MTCMITDLMLICFIGNATSVGIQYELEEKRMGDRKVSERKASSSFYFRAKFT